MLTDRAFVMALAGEALRLRESNAALQPPTDCQALLEAQQSLLEAQGTEVINVDSCAVTIAAPQEGAEPPRKRQRLVEAAAAHQVTEANRWLVVVKKEKAEAIEDEQDDKQDLALFIDKLQDKLDRLKALALASKNVDPAEVHRILNMH
jgi:hypothetical protein